MTTTSAARRSPLAARYSALRLGKLANRYHAPALQSFTARKLASKKKRHRAPVFCAAIEEAATFGGEFFSTARNNFFAPQQWMLNPASTRAADPGKGEIVVDSAYLLRLFQSRPPKLAGQFEQSESRVIPLRSTLST